MAPVPLECTRDKGLSNIWSMIPVVSSSSLKCLAAILRGANLLSQTGPVNESTMGHCLVHFTYSQTDVEKYRSQIKDNDLQTMCSVCSPYCEPPGLHLSISTCIEGV
ncbi:hypothetical protein TNIN_237601 [Trichonephila inaurata madagascariensis]|uniref:Uncharacterized protein n=1 Tax=Trichonephila inaurata madagascariensis TaxID=2747483 RepID=A0A8X6X8C6_9ARAC|nr:hypothetical protein TNIN_237601 [Trichonephila inaurata madagascariensis]